MEEKYMIDVDHATVRFNMATERIDNLKEYFVKLVKKQLMFQEFLALKDGQWNHCAADRTWCRF